MDFVIARLREPSTYAGLAALIGGISILPNASSLAGTITLAGTFIAGVLAIWLPEKKA